MCLDQAIIGHMGILNMGLNMNKLFKKKLERLLKNAIHFNVFFYYTHLVEGQDQALELIF